MCKKIEPQYFIIIIIIIFFSGGTFSVRPRVQLPLNCKKGGEGEKRLQMVDGKKRKKESKKERNGVVKTAAIG